MIKAKGYKMDEIDGSLSLEEIASRMQGLGADDPDWGGPDIEHDHCEADDLLQEAILHLGKMQGGQAGTLCKEIIDAYDRLFKWYA